MLYTKKRSRPFVLQHLHHPVDEVFVFLGYVGGAFGGRGDEGRRPDTVGMLMSPVLRLLPQVDFLFLVQVRDSLEKRRRVTTGHRSGERRVSGGATVTVLDDCSPTPL